MAFYEKYQHNVTHSGQQLDDDEALRQRGWGRCIEAPNESTNRWMVASTEVAAARASNSVPVNMIV